MVTGHRTRQWSYSPLGQTPRSTPDAPPLVQERVREVEDDPHPSGSAPPKDEIRLGRKDHDAHSLPTIHDAEVQASIGGVGGKPPSITGRRHRRMKRDIADPQSRYVLSVHDAEPAMTSGVADSTSRAMLSLCERSS